MLGEGCLPSTLGLNQEDILMGLGNNLQPEGSAIEIQITERQRCNEIS